ncbi:unnamed protein product [Oikopleura dioica]|uniref:Uncharacterized protein n=1 Tax=Oikopleura dioica TaxID=34765 RepID=E4XI30_OIKDI|nr:unnamed protein product [Oikopleura dioica]CBY36297.1 unnamed protein product [Oikopleura dioica]
MLRTPTGRVATISDIPSLQNINHVGSPNQQSQFNS